MAFHSNQRRVIDHGDRLLSWAQEWQLVEIEINGQVHLAIRTFDVGRKEFGLQVH